MRCETWVVSPAGGGREMSMAVWALAPDGDYVYAVARKGERLVATKKYFGLSGASMLVQFLSSVGCPIFWHQTIGAPFFSLRGGVVPPGGRQVNITKVRDGPHPQPLQGPRRHRMTDT